MRCRTCNYALWNLPGRQCPECGSAFKPSDFEFIPSAVKFCCRHCMQPYYGTTWQGHLMPVAFTCVSCAAPVHMDDTIVLPTEGVDEERTIQGVNPWLDRRRGFFGRFFTSIGHAMVKPGQMARGTPIGSPHAAAAGFALLAHTLVYSICWGPQVLLMGLGGAAGIASGLMFVGGFVVAAIVGLWIWGLVAHALLKITGPTAGGMGRTYTALYYSSGANMLSAFPCMGFMFGWIWWVISATIMLREMQRVSGGRAALACLVPPVLVVGLAFMGYVYFISATMTQVARMQTQAAQQAAAAAQQAARQGAAPDAQFGSVPPAVAGAEVYAGLRAFADATQGALPRHPAELVSSRRVRLPAFFLTGSRSGDLTARVGGRPLRDLDLLPPGERIDAFAQAIAIERAQLSTGDGSAWTRLGDVLLADLGSLTLEQAGPPGLWLLSACPDPEVNEARIGDDGQRLVGVMVVSADGTVSELAAPDVRPAIEAQNAIRRGQGLPELGDPRDVPHRSRPVP